MCLYGILRSRVSIRKASSASDQARPPPVEAALRCFWVVVDRGDCGLAISEDWVVGRGGLCVNKVDM